MIRLNLKSDLINECCEIFLNINRFGQIDAHGNSNLPKSFKKLAIKSVNRDFKKGLKEINKKASVFIELPQYEKINDGIYSKNYKNELLVDKEIIIENNTPMVIE